MFVLQTHRIAVGCSVEVFPSNALSLKSMPLILDSQVCREVSPNRKSCIPALKRIARIAHLWGGSDASIHREAISKQGGQDGTCQFRAWCAPKAGIPAKNRRPVNLHPTTRNTRPRRAWLGALWCTWNYTAEGLEVVCLLGTKQEAYRNFNDNRKLTPVTDWLCLTNPIR